MEELQVEIVKVDCVANRNLCAQQRVMAFPTLRLFKDGEVFAPDYKQDRTVKLETTRLSDVSCNVSVVDRQTSNCPSSTGCRVSCCVASRDAYILLSDLLSKKDL